MSLPIIPDDDTAFAPAGRSDDATIRRQRGEFLSDATAVTMLEAMPGPAMVLNRQRQVVAVNGELTSLLGADGLDRLLGQRPGEMVGCVHAKERRGGCGTSEACATCGAVNAIVDALKSRGRSVKECRIVTEGAGGGSLDFRVFAHHIAFGYERFVILGLTDISGEKRRQVLERTFFHDLVNEVGGLHGLAEILNDDGVEPVVEAECKLDILRLSSAVLDEIQGHRQMLAAERGTLELRRERVSIAALVDDVVHAFRHHPVAEDRTLEVTAGDEVQLRSDPVLLRRVLGNLVKNALEAIPRGAAVTVGWRVDDGHVTLFTRNPGAMPRDVQLQIFQRSFSTKGGEGRGVGTYSVKLFAERFLGGQVGFTSDEPSGTEFHVRLPRAAGSPGLDAAA